MTYITDKAFKNVLASSTAHTTGQSAGGWGSPAGITGSAVTYTPLSSSSQIVYEVSFYADSQNRMNMYQLNIQESTNSGVSWSTIDVEYGKMFGFASDGDVTGQDQRFFLNCQFIIPSWSGARMLRTMISGQRPWVTNASLHHITDWDGSSASNMFCNTSVLVHEV